MFKLESFFQPLNFQTLAIFVFLWLFFDILGSYTKHHFLKIDKSDTYRIIDWLIGFAIFIFLWFVISQFIPYKQEYIVLSIIILFLPSGYYYVKDLQYLKILRELWDLKVPILIISLFLPAVFVKSSLPPYYADEMAYHFISPSALTDLKPIRFVGGFYSELPETLDLFFRLVFSLTHTYSIARLFHFSILATSMVFAYKIIKLHLGWFAAFIFILTYFSFPQDTVLVATLGYIDVGAYSFMLIGIVSGMDFLYTKRKDSLLLSFLFWALSIGTKYTSLTAFTAYLIISTIAVVFHRKTYLKTIKNNALPLIVVFFIFGGYWYLKNFIMFGNPIFPFIFPCWGKHVEACPYLSGFFDGWMMEVTLANAKIIFSQLIVKNRLLQLAVVLAPFIALFAKNSKSKFITYATFSIVIIELIFLKYFSGYHIRYQQHMQLYLILGTAALLSNRYKLSFLNNLKYPAFVFLFISIFVSYLSVVKYTNSLKFLNWYEINYATGTIGIYEWIDYYLPKMKYTIDWCENPPGMEKVALARWDPDLIWYEYDGYMRSFITNCYYANPPLQGEALDNVLNKAKKDEMEFWVASSTKCLNEEEMAALRKSNEDDQKHYLRKLNNLVVCNSKEVKPYLFYFDYRNIKI